MYTEQRVQYLLDYLNLLDETQTERVDKVCDEIEELLFKNDISNLTELPTMGFSK